MTLIEILTIVAIIVGPLAAVLITERSRNRHLMKERREHVFRTLMATRNANLSPNHVEALNLVDVLFEGSGKKNRRVLDQWRLYIDHLSDRKYPRDSWGVERQRLMTELLYELSSFLGKKFDKSHIKKGTYYPDGYERNDFEMQETRKLWLEILNSKRALPVITFQPPQKEDQGQQDTGEE